MLDELELGAGTGRAAGAIHFPGGLSFGAHECLFPIEQTAAKCLSEFHPLPETATHMPEIE
jgi:hypothetical protein